MSTAPPPTERARPSSAQSPKVGLAHRLLGSMHVTGVFWYRFHRFGVSILPEWALVGVTVFFTSFFFVALRNIRRGIASNLDVVLGPCSWAVRQRRIFRTMWIFAWCLSERYERMGGDDVEVAEVEGREHWAEAELDGRGVIFVTAHIGHWEVGAMTAPSGQDKRVHVVREEEMDPRAQKFLAALFADMEQTFKIHFAKDDLSLGTSLLTALRQGDIVALQGDRPRASGRTVEATIFGRTIVLPAGPAALARAAKVELLPVFVFRDGRHRSRIVIKPPVRVPQRQSGEARDQQLTAAMQEVASHIEWAIREEPHQWFCFRELWPKGG